MRNASVEFERHLAGEATTLAFCWKVTRTDGQVKGFTNHDESLEFGGATYEPNSAVSRSSISSADALAAGNLDIVGALTSEELSESDLEEGLWDSAKVEMFVVNWQDPAAQHMQIFEGYFGDIERTEDLFTIDIRSVIERFNVSQGRIFQRNCSADLGDSKCRVNLDLSVYNASATVSKVTSPLEIEAEILGFASGWFSQGAVTWETGANADVKTEIRRHTQESRLVWTGIAESHVQTGKALITFQSAPFHAVNVGDRFRIDAGCDKSLATCRQKFENTENFRGFPHMPSNDAVLRVGGRPAGGSS